MKTVPITQIRPEIVGRIECGCGCRVFEKRERVSLVGLKRGSQRFVGDEPTDSKVEFFCTRCKKPLRKKSAVEVSQETELRRKL